MFFIIWKRKICSLWPNVYVSFLHCKASSKFSQIRGNLRRPGTEQTCFNLPLLSLSHSPTITAVTIASSGLKREIRPLPSYDETCETMKPPVGRESFKMWRFCTPKWWERLYWEASDESTRGKRAKVSHTKWSLQNSGFTHLRKAEGGLKDSRWLLSALASCGFFLHLLHLQPNKTRHSRVTYLLCHLSVYLHLFWSIKTMNYLETSYVLLCVWMYYYCPWAPTFPAITGFSLYFLTVKLNLTTASIYINSSAGLFSAKMSRPWGLSNGGKQVVAGVPWRTRRIHCHLRLAADGLVDISEQSPLDIGS